MLAFALFPALPATAADVPPVVLAAPCGGCHAPRGVGATPSLDQLDAATIAAKLNGFRSGTVEATVMNRIAKGYTDSEIAALAQYFAELQR